MGGVRAVHPGVLLSRGVSGPPPAPVWLPPGGHPLLCLWRAGILLRCEPPPQTGCGGSAR